MILYPFQQSVFSPIQRRNGNFPPQLRGWNINPIDQQTVALAYTAAATDRIFIVAIRYERLIKQSSMPRHKPLTMRKIHAFVTRLASIPWLALSELAKRLIFTATIALPH